MQANQIPYPETKNESEFKLRLTLNKMKLMKTHPVAKRNPKVRALTLPDS